MSGEREACVSGVSADGEVVRVSLGGGGWDGPEVWSDEAVAGLVGQEPVRLFDRACRMQAACSGVEFLAELRAGDPEARWGHDVAVSLRTLAPFATAAVMPS